MKIIIAGGAGFIGSHLVDKVLKRGHSTVVIDNLCTGQENNIAHNLHNPNFQFHNVDITNYQDLEQSCTSADIIFNLVAHKIPKYGNASKVLFVNSFGAANILRLARKMDAKVIMISSSDVYGKNNNQPLKEDEDLLLGPSDIKRWSYSVSKIFDEQLSFAYAEDYGLKIVILRYFSVYGPRMHPSWRAGPQSTFINAAIKGEELIVHGDGNQKRTFCYIDDIVDGTIRAAKTDKAVGQIINLGSNREISILDFAKLINLLVGNSLNQNIKFIPHEKLFGRFEEIYQRLPDLSKAKKILNWEPKLELKDGIIRTIQKIYDELNIHTKLDIRNIETYLEKSLFSVD